MKLVLSRDPVFSDKRLRLLRLLLKRKKWRLGLLCVSCLQFPVYTMINFIQWFLPQTGAKSTLTEGSEKRLCLVWVVGFSMSPPLIFCFWMGILSKFKYLKPNPYYRLFVNCNFQGVLCYLTNRNSWRCSTFSGG